MNAITRIPRLVDICPEYREASAVYERECQKGNEKSIADAWSLLSQIAQVFWTGVEYGRHVPEDDGIRAWRAEG